MPYILAVAIISDQFDTIPFMHRTLTIFFSSAGNVCSETHFEDMLCAYLKIWTESHVTAGISKGTVNTLGLDIPIPSIFLLKIWWSQIKTLKLIQMFLCSGLICLIAAEYEPRKLTQHSLKYCQLDPANAGYTVANRTCRRGWLHK
jgi:hypothetical protein